MGVITISLDKETEAMLRKVAKTTNMKKGALANVIKTALQEYYRKLELKEIQARQLALLEKGIKIGFKGYKDRGELYER